MGKTGEIATSSILSGFGRFKDRKFSFQQTAGNDETFAAALHAMDSFIHRRNQTCPARRLVSMKSDGGSFNGNMFIAFNNAKNPVIAFRASDKIADAGHRTSCDGWAVKNLDHFASMVRCIMQTDNASFVFPERHETSFVRFTLTNP